MSDYNIAFVRTATPIIVGWLTASAVGTWLDPAVATEAVAALVALVYYATVRYAETTLGHERAGWLLGVAMQPVYQLDTDVMEQATPADD